jgi:hypothetical protein
MRVLAAFVDLELCDHLERKLVLRQHPANGLVQNQLRLTLQSRLGADRSLARVTGVPAILFLFPLLAAELHLLGIEDNDKIARINMWRVRRAVLAHEQNSNPAGKPADDLVGGINCVPLLLDFTGLGHVGFHDSYAARCQAQNVVQLMRIQQFTAAGGGLQGREFKGKHEFPLLHNDIIGTYG